MSPDDLEDRLIDFAVRVVNAVDADNSSFVNQQSSIDNQQSFGTLIVTAIRLRSLSCTVLF